MIFITRIVVLIFSVLLIIDTRMPTLTEHLVIERHAYGQDTDYDIHLRGGRVSYCTVNYENWQRLQDGEELDVESTQLFHRCVRIAQDGRVIESTSYWRYLTWALVALIAS